MIIHQGRPVDKSTNDMSKSTKRDMIRFGLDQIMNSDGEAVIDIDLDKILKEGEVKTADENDKYSQMGESQLRNLTLEEASSVSLYQFEGEDFRLKNRAANNDDAYKFRERKTVQYTSVAAKQTKPKFLNDYKFYPRALFEMSENSDGWIDLVEDTEHKENLIKQGFDNWNKNDFKS